MKIYKNNANITLSLDEFLDLLEEDALEDVFIMLMDLDETGSINPNNLYSNDVTYEYYYVDSEDFDELLNGLGDIDYMFDEEDMYAMSDEELDMVFGVHDSYEDFDEIDPDYAGEMGSLADELLMSNEDLRIRRIVNRFKHILS